MWRPAHLANMASVVVNGIMSEGPGAESVPDTKPQPELVIGLLAAPGPASELTESLVGEIADRLAGQLPGVRWRVEFVSDRLVEPPTDLSELIAAGRRMLLERGWHLAVCVTDLPLETARRPVIAHVSARPTGSRSCPMPALGPVAVRKRAADAIVRLVGNTLGDSESWPRTPPNGFPAGRGRDPPHARTGRLARSAASKGWVSSRGSSPATSGCCWACCGPTARGGFWHCGLMRALAVAFAAGVFALVTSDILAALLLSSGPLRLVVISFSARWRASA